MRLDSAQRQGFLLSAQGRESAHAASRPRCRPL